MTERVHLLDVNVLVALALDTHVHHRSAHSALGSLPGPWATCAMTEAALLRLLLNPQVTGSSFTAAEVIAALTGMRQDPGWRFLPDGTSLGDPVIDTSVLVGHRQVTDFHLVNLAARHHALLATFDTSLPPALAGVDRRHVVVLPAD